MVFVALLTDNQGMEIKFSVKKIVDIKEITEEMYEDGECLEILYRAESDIAEQLESIHLIPLSKAKALGESLLESIEMYEREETLDGTKKELSKENLTYPEWERSLTDLMMEDTGATNSEQIRE